MGYFSTHDRLRRQLNEEIKDVDSTVNRATTVKVDRRMRKYLYANAVLSGMSEDSDWGKVDLKEVVNISSDFTPEELNGAKTVEVELSNANGDDEEGNLNDMHIWNTVAQTSMGVAVNSDGTSDSLSPVAAAVDRFLSYARTTYFSTIAMNFFKYLMWSFLALIVISGIPGFANLLRSQAWGSTAFVFLLFVQYLFNQARERLVSSGNDPKRMERMLAFLRSLCNWMRDYVPATNEKRRLTTACCTWLTRNMLVMFMMASQISKAGSGSGISYTLRIPAARMIREFFEVTEEMDRCLYSMASATPKNSKPPPTAELKSKIFDQLEEIRSRILLPDTVALVTLHVTIGIRLYMYLILTLQIFGEIGGLIIIIFPFIMSIFDGLFAIIQYVDHPFDSNTSRKDNQMFSNLSRYTYWYVIATVLDSSKVHSVEALERVALNVSDEEQSALKEHQQQRREQKRLRRFLPFTSSYSSDSPDKMEQLLGLIADLVGTMQEERSDTTKSEASDVYYHSPLPADTDLRQPRTNSVLVPITGYHTMDGDVEDDDDDDDNEDTSGNIRFKDIPAEDTSNNDVQTL